MKTLNILISCIVVLTIGCQNKDFKDHKHLKQVFEKEYFTGFWGRCKIIKVKDKEFICHYDFVTHKKIIAESLSDDELHTISIENALKKSLYGIVAFEIVDWDNIYLVEKYSTKLSLINEGGEVKRRIDLDPYLKLSGHYELVCLTREFIMNDTSMLFALEFRPENLPEYLQDNIEAYDSMRYLSPRLFKVDNFYKDTFKVHFGAENLYRRFVAEDILALDRFNYRYVNNQILFTSMYTDSIYCIDPNTLNVKNAFGIQSDYTGLIVNHMSRAEADQDNERFMNNVDSNGKILNIVFDQLSKNYFVTIVHKKRGEAEAKLAWSLIVLDEEFQKEEEIKMDEDKYHFLCNPSLQGLYIDSNPSHEADTNYRQKNNYAVFRYE